MDALVLHSHGHSSSSRLPPCTNSSCFSDFAKVAILFSYTEASKCCIYLHLRPVGATHLRIVFRRGRGRSLLVLPDIPQLFDEVAPRRIWLRLRIDESMRRADHIAVVAMRLEALGDQVDKRVDVAGRD